MGFAAQVQQPQVSDPTQAQGVATTSGINIPVDTTSAVAAPTDGTKGKPFPQPQGKGAFSYSPLSGQPQMGQSNPYPNTVGIGDNATKGLVPQVGKGKG